MICLASLPTCSDCNSGSTCIVCRPPEGRPYIDCMHNEPRQVQMKGKMYQVRRQWPFLLVAIPLNKLAL